MGDNGGVDNEVTLTVRLSKTNGLVVNGPGDGRVYDEPLCFWLLDKAKDFIKIRNAQMVKSNIIIPDIRIREKM